MSCYIGIDLGGTTIKVGRVESGRLTGSEVFPVNPSGSRESIYSNICTLILRLWNERVEGIGFAVPAVIDFASGTIYGLSNIPCFNGFAIQKALEDRFKVPVRIQNDANCFVLGEKYFGGAIGFENIVGLITGTGVGAGIIIDGKIYNGKHYGAGEFGMIPYKESCFEAYCSGQFFSSFYHVAGEEMARRAGEGDTKAALAYYNYGVHLGELINLICYALDPEIIIVGGSVSKSFNFYKSGLTESLKGFYFDHREIVKILPSTLNDIAIYGAAGLFFDPSEQTLTR